MSDAVDGRSAVGSDPPRLAARQATHSTQHSARFVIVFTVNCIRQHRDGAARTATSMWHEARARYTGAAVLSSCRMNRSAETCVR
eukprot:5286026-Prymnesium_polylepis.1